MYTHGNFQEGSRGGGGLSASDGEQILHSRMCYTYLLFIDELSQFSDLFSWSV